MKTDYSKWKYWDFNLAERQKDFDDDDIHVEKWKPFNSRIENLNALIKKLNKESEGNKRPNVEYHDGDLVQPIRIEPIPNGGSLSKKTITNYLYISIFITVITMFFTAIIKNWQQCAN